MGKDYYLFTVMPEGEKVWEGAVVMFGDNLPSPGSGIAVLHTKNK